MSDAWAAPIASRGQPSFGRRGAGGVSGVDLKGLKPPSLRILVVEDNPADADLVREALRDISARRVEVDCVSRVGDAERRLGSSTPPDIVLLDLRLPDAEGLEGLDRLLGVAHGAPIVVLTGSDDGGVAAEAVHRGAQDFLSKDVLLHTDQLVRSIWYSLERYSLLREARRQGRLARAAEFQLRRLVQSNADGMIVLDPGGIVVFANRAAESLLGAQGGDLLGAPLAFEVDEGAGVEIEVDGRPVVFEMRSADIEWNGAPARLLSLRDVTQRRAAEQLRARLLHSDRLRSIGQLAAGVAHEINNPAAFVAVNQETLRAKLDHLGKTFDAVRDLVAGWGDVPLKELERELRRLSIDGELAEACATLDENRIGLDRIISIVRSLRGFARVEQGHVEQVNVDELVEDACNMVRNAVRHRAKLIKELGGPPSISVDRGRITQVLVNLLVNASQALDENLASSNRITVRTHFDGKAVHIEVEDTGCGIPEDVRSHIFEPFFTTKGREEGTGLGLSLSAEIARQHKGELRLESEAGVGTCFELVLPLDNGLGLTRRPTQEPPPAPAREGLRVLVIDDEPALLRAMKRMLGRRHEIVTALGGTQALQTLEVDHGFDAILCDLMMPGVDGPAVHQWLQSHAPGLLSHVAFMSGGAFTGRTRSFCDQPDVRVIDKPVSAEALEALLTELE